MSRPRMVACVCGLVLASPLLLLLGLVSLLIPTDPNDGYWHQNL